MVMIPTDVGVQVRSQTEAPLHPLRPIAEISSDLPDLQKGQVFRAQIREVLPENTFKALVAGSLLTLSLPKVPRRVIRWIWWSSIAHRVRSWRKLSGVA